MVRKGRFAIIDGKEYGLFSSGNQYYLKSTNPLDLANGFSLWRGRENVFIKKISFSKIERAYEIIPYVMLNSHRFIVESVNHQTSKVTLVTSNPFVQQKMNVKPYRNNEYVIECPLSEVTIEEEKMPISGFEKDHLFPFNLIREVE